MVPGASSHLYEKHFLMCWTYLGRLLNIFIISSLKKRKKRKLCYNIEGVLLWARLTEFNYRRFGMCVRKCADFKIFVL